MDQKERQERWKQDTGALYRVIGEFVVTFEHACHAIQVCVIFLLGNAGLTNQRATQIILAGVTADPLRTLFESLVGELVELNDAERKIIKNAVSRFQKLTESRNDIIHTTWFVGWGNEDTTDFSEASGHKYHKNKSGAVFKSFHRKVDDFAELISEAQALANIFLRLNGCLTGGRSVEKNFVVSKEGKVSVPPSAS
jgi:hypothetical protein